MTDLEKLWEEKLNGWAWQIKSEFLALLKLMQEKRVRSVFEIGTNKGGTAYGFCSVGCFVDSVDIQKLPEIAKVNYEFPWKFNFHQMYSKDVSVMHLYDMLFIDGDHSYDAVKLDYERFVGNVEFGGIVVFHDIKDTELHAKQNCHVAKFWKEIRGENYVEFCDPLEQWGGIGVKFL